MLWFTENGKLALCDNGKVANTDDCPCNPCGSLTDYYIDKYATGTGDGLSWENAFTELPTTNMNEGTWYIQGYGKLDRYIIYSWLSINQCARFIGVGDVWLDAGSEITTNYAISILGFNRETAGIMNNINVYHSNIFAIPSSLVDIVGDGSVLNCNIDGGGLFSAVGIDSDSQGILYNCEIYECKTGVNGGGNSVEANNCTSNNNSNEGFFNINGVLTDCSASNNGGYGFYRCCNPLNSGLTGTGNTLGLIGGCP